MDLQRNICLRVLGLLLLVLIFTMKAQAAVDQNSFPQKQETDLATALDQARAEMKQIISTYNHEHQFNLEDELMEAKDEAKVQQEDVASSVPSIKTTFQAGI